MDQPENLEHLREETQKGGIQMNEAQNRIKNLEKRIEELKKTTNDSVNLGSNPSRQPTN